MIPDFIVGIACSPEVEAAIMVWEEEWDMAAMPGPRPPSLDLRVSLGVAVPLVVRQLLGVGLWALELAPVS